MERLEEAHMLKDKQPMATLAVKELAAARKFYEGAVGLEAIVRDEMGVATYRCGSSTILVYESKFAGTNQATAVTWNVGKNIEETVAELKAKGVTFERYDIPGAKKEGELHVFGELKNAWFKDPDGNIHSIVNQ
jgi:catechol 2,3-dioxygenase-like lactoylglutathione lyase family enzyme